MAHIKRWKGHAREQLRRTAYHEAGHTVAHRVVGIVCGEASIVPKMCGGFVIAADQRRGKLRDRRSVLVGRIICFMAGREAEIVAFGDEHEIGDGDDLLQIALMAEDAGVSEAYLERMRRKVRPLPRRHWHKVAAVADALLVRKTLSGPEIDALISKVTTPRERTIAKRIEVAHKPMRDLVAWKFREGVR
jgi:ATP-dependent Zn protease